MKLIKMIELIKGNVKHADLRVSIKGKKMFMENGNEYLRLYMTDNTGSMYANVFPTHFAYQTYLMYHETLGSYMADVQVSLMNESIPHLKQLKIHHMKLEDKHELNSEVITSYEKNKFKNSLLSIQNKELQQLIIYIFSNKKFVDSYFELKHHDLNIKQFKYTLNLIKLIEFLKIKTFDKDVLIVASILEPIGLLYPNRLHHLHHTMYTVDFLYSIDFRLSREVNEALVAALTSSWSCLSVKKPSYLVLYDSLKNKTTKQVKNLSFN